MSVDVEYAMNPFAGKEGNEQNLGVKLIASGSEDLTEILAAVTSFVPYSLANLWLQDVEGTPLSPDTWDCTANYATAKPTDEPTFTIEVGGTNARITQSLATVGGYGQAGDTSPIPSFMGAIGVTKDSVEGTDILVPNITWSEHHLLPLAMVNQGYVYQLYQCVARMNQNPWRIFDVGEALFIGCTLQLSSQRTGYAADFRWIGSPNSTNITVGSINVAQKYGHDYLWVKYNDATSAGNAVKMPKYVFVERVYQFADYSILNLDEPS